MCRKVCLEKGLLSAASCCQGALVWLGDGAGLAEPAVLAGYALNTRAKWAKMGDPTTSRDPSPLYRKPGLLTWGFVFGFVQVCVLQF